MTDNSIVPTHYVPPQRAEQQSSTAFSPTSPERSSRIRNMVPARGRLGGPGWWKTQGSHRSIPTRLTLTVPQLTGSLCDGTQSGIQPRSAADAAPAAGRNAATDMALLTDGGKAFLPPDWRGRSSPGKGGPSISFYVASRRGPESACRRHPPRRRRLGLQSPRRLARGSCGAARKRGRE